MPKINETISHYRILEKIGEGGMGEVFLAEDTKLKRKVALKFLPSELTRNSEVKERFIHEAQAASGLQHNNICTIHEIVESKLIPEEQVYSQMFICMDYYEGESLKKKIEHGPLNFGEALDIAIQMAAGLEKAHQKDIIHRDIKPANIMITICREVKIVDFGLAKLAGQIKLTKEGTTLGTVAYMSPEQAGGEEIDHRTDIWSMGVVLYEMITGQLPFKGEYEQAVVYSILNDSPRPITSIYSDVPKKLEVIVKRALKKNTKDRYQHVTEMLDDMQSLQQSLASLPSKKINIRNLFLKPIARIIVVALLFAILIVGYLLTRNGKMDFQIKRSLPLTTAPGLEQDPSWSPEGTRIAYASGESGNMDIWVRQIAAGQRVNLTENYAGYDGKPAWSPDGEWIAFVSERNGGGIFIIPALGGIPKQVISLSFAISLSRTGSIPDISWSPNGTELVYAVAGRLYTVSSAGGSPSTLPLPPTGLTVGYLQPTWSPDGKRIACTGIVGQGIATSQIWLLHHKGIHPLPVTDGNHLDHNPVWAPDGKHIFFISDRGGSSDVWWMAVDSRGSPTGQASPLTAGAGVGAIALSKDGTKLAYSKAVDRSNIWSIPIVQDRMFTLAEAQPLTSENHYIESLDISPDGQWIAFDSNRRGNMDIWIMRKDGSELRQLTTNQAHDWFPTWSPDGKKILFHSFRPGNRDLFVIPVGGGALQQLTNHPAEDLAPIWSPDGKKIAFLSNRSGNIDVWVMLSDGSKLQQLTFQDAQEFILIWSLDGKQIVFCTNRTGYYELFSISAEQFLLPNQENKPMQLTRGEWAYICPLYWTKDGKTIFAYGVGGPFNQGANLWAVSVADGSARPILDLRGTFMEPFYSISSDGERIYFPLVERFGDLWMAELSIDE